MTLIAFDEPHLARAMENLAEAEIDKLPFGVVKLASDGKVLLHSATERAQSGWKKRPSVGLDFFLNVAPCMTTGGLPERIEAARARGEIDIEMGWIGDYNDIERVMTIRVQSASDKGLWIFIKRD